jgi:hypothetical protein
MRMNADVGPNRALVRTGSRGPFNKLMRESNA